MNGMKLPHYLIDANHGCMRVVDILMYIILYYVVYGCIVYKVHASLQKNGCGNLTCFKQLLHLCDDDHDEHLLPCSPFLLVVRMYLGMIWTMHT